MSCLIGILVDVSGSMRNSVGGRVEAGGGSWAKSIFKVVDELIKHDVPSSNQTFALALGCPSEPQVFDLLGTVYEATEELRHIKDLRRKTLTEIIDEILDILERSGAPRVRHWGKMEVLTKVLGDGNDGTAAAILHYLQRTPDFKRRFVHECLPTECREVVMRVSNLAFEGAYSLMSFLPNNWQAQEWATEDSVREAVEKGKQLVKETRTKMVHVSKAAIMSVQSASDILHTSTGDQEMTEEQVDELLEAVEPYIYGRTPLIQAMRYSVDLFSQSQETSVHPF